MRAIKNFIAAAVVGPSCLLADLGFHTESVTFESHGTQIMGTLYRPKDVPADRRLPAIVVTGAWMTVKEQMPANYAAALAQRGFSALTFDFRGWGESAGERRQLEDPAAKAEDIRAAFGYLSTRSDVDPDRLGGLAVCASAGYLTLAAQSDAGKTIRSIATVAPWLHDRELAEKIYGGREKVDTLISKAAEAEKAFRTSGVQSFVTAASTTDKSAIMFGVPYYTEPTRGGIPAWRNEADPAFWNAWLSFDAMAAAPHLVQPFFMVQSDAAALPEGAKKFFSLVRSPKHEMWIKEATQFDFYDNPRVVGKAADAAAAHFHRTLVRAEASSSVGTPNNVAIAGVVEFFAALEAMDIPRFLDLWAEDAVQEMPYAPGTFPKKLIGKEAVRKQYEPLPAAFEGMKFTLQRLQSTDRPDVVLAEYQGTIRLKSGGRYDNRYVSIFAFNEDGRLEQFVEYFDPFVLIAGFPGADKLGMPDEQRIQMMVAELAAAADARDWNRLESLFSETVHLDYTSVAGGEPIRVTREQLVKGWREGLGAYQATKHNFSDVIVETSGDAATARFTGQATHLKTDNSRWNCGGEYEYVFERQGTDWRITSARFLMRWEQGSRT